MSKSTMVNEAPRYTNKGKIYTIYIKYIYIWTYLDEYVVK